MPCHSFIFFTFKAFKVCTGSRYKNPILVKFGMIWSNYSDFTRVPHPEWWFSKGIPLISGKSRLVKYYNLARMIQFCTPQKYRLKNRQPTKVGEQKLLSSSKLMENDY